MEELFYVTNFHTFHRERKIRTRPGSVRFARVMIHDRLAFRMRRRSASSASIHEIILWRLFDYQTWLNWDSNGTTMEYNHFVWLHNTLIPQQIDGDAKQKRLNNWCACARLFCHSWEMQGPHAISTQVERGKTEMFEFFVGLFVWIKEKSAPLIPVDWSDGYNSIFLRQFNWKSR